MAAVTPTSRADWLSTVIRQPCDKAFLTLGQTYFDGSASVGSGEGIGREESKSSEVELRTSGMSALLVSRSSVHCISSLTRSDEL